jgi:uncharacterized protein YlxW (UPF0749 family)
MSDPDLNPGTATRRRRPDASMDLLNAIVRQPIDPQYRELGRAPVHVRRRPGRWDLAVVVAVMGTMFALAAVQTTRSAPVLESERRQLIDRVQQAEARQDELRTRVEALSREIDQLRRAAQTDPSARLAEAGIGRLAPVVAAQPVTGPGLRLEVDDAPGSADTRDQVLDVDLQIMVNGLWQAGAEAVGVNGHRLSALTAIRHAGDAITVDYRSLTRPYRIEAIGDPRTLPARWVQSPGGQWWNDLARNRSMTYEVNSVDDISLPADPGLRLRHATRATP